MRDVGVSESAAAIMDDPVLDVDLRGMLCAQALAVIASAAKKLDDGESAQVFVSTEDVLQDVLAWAKALNYDVRTIEPFRLLLRRGERPAGGR